MSDQKHYSFFAGMPTRPDVDAILKEHPSIAPGWRCSRAALAGIVGLSGESGRWKSVATALASRLRREHGVVMLYDRSTKEYFIARASDTIARTTDVFRSVGRKLGHHRKDLVATAVTATEAERPVVEHQTRLAHAMEREAKKQNMNLLPPTQPEQVRIQPPKVG